MTEVVEKTCSACRETKPVSAFHKDASRPDGFNSQCKTCRAEQYQCLSPGVARSIESLDQIGSVVRVMAELQGVIEAEQALCEEEVQKHRDWSLKETEPWAAKLDNWNRMVREFFLKHTLKGAAERKYTFRFGCVEVCGKRVSVTLNSKLAAASSGKP